MPWFLYLALKHLFPTGKRVSFFTLISIVGVSLGVGVLVVVMSVMTGFHTDIRRMVVDTEGEIQIKSSQAITHAGQIVARVNQVPGVASSTPYAAGLLFIESGHRPSAPAMRGIDLDTVENVVNLRRYIVEGSLDDMDDDSVILSAELARSAHLSVGSSLEVYSPLFFEKIKSDELFLPRQVRVVGVLEIGHQQLDSSTIYCTLRLAQDLYGLGDAVHGINVRLKPGFDEDETASRINQVLPVPMQAYSWMDTFSDFLWVLQLEKNMIFFLLLFIVLVAGFSVASSLLISVVRKTREIGVLSALGGSASQVAACFCFQGLFIGVFGTALGLGFGFVMLAVRNDIILWILKITQRQEVLQRFYQFSRLPSHTDPQDILKIVVASIVISVLAGLFPAWRASRLSPVEALRSE